MLRRVVAGYPTLYEMDRRTMNKRESSLPSRGETTGPAQAAEAGSATLSISLDGLIKDGSDREFRRMIYELIMLRTTV